MDAGEGTSKPKGIQESSDDPVSSGYDRLAKCIDSMQAKLHDLTQQVTSFANERDGVKISVLSSVQSKAEQLSQLIANESAERKTVESVLEMWHIAVEEIEILEKKLAEKASGREFEERIEEVKAEYVKALESLSEELAVARIELRNLKNDLKNKNGQLDENKKVIENVSVELAKKEKQIKDAFLKERDMSSKIMSLEISLAEVKKVVTEKNEDISIMGQKLNESLSMNEDLRVQNAELKAQKLAAQKDSKENLLTTEKAVLEKEEALYKEQQALKEIQLLKNSINQAVEQTAARYKAEIQNIQQQFDKRIEALLKEIQVLELENNEKQNMYERSVREKEAMESELQSLYEKNANGTPVSNNIFEDTLQKLTDTERAKKEFELEVEALRTSLKDVKLSHEQEIQLLQNESRRAKTRLQHMQTDFSNVLLSRTQLTDEVELLKKRCYKAEKELTNIKSGHQNVVSLLEQKLLKKEHTHQHQLQMITDQHKRAVGELQLLLDAQYDINNKWKDEVQELTKKSESKIKELYEDNVRLHQQNEELSRTLQQKQIVQSAASYLSPYGIDGNQINANR